MRPFFFDIETIPSQDPAIRDELRAAVTAPAKYTNPESIAEWMEENREREAESAWLKTSFDGGLGQIVCIGFASGDDNPQSYHVGDLSREKEADMLEFFFCSLVDAGPRTLVGHNIIGFDIPFIWKRAMILGVRPPSSFPRSPKPWSDLVADTMLMWDGQQRAGGSMDRLCKLMGIPGKGAFSGADVWPAIQRGEFDRVSSYCRDDVARTRALYRRMMFIEAGA